MTTEAEHLTEMADRYDLHTPAERAALITSFVAKIATHVVSSGHCPANLAIAVTARDAAQAAQVAAEAQRDADAAIIVTRNTTITTLLTELGRIQGLVNTGVGVPADLATERDAVWTVQDFYGQPRST